MCSLQLRLQLAELCVQTGLQLRVRLYLLAGQQVARLVWLCGLLTCFGWLLWDWRLGAEWSAISEVTGKSDCKSIDHYKI
jgi:hypothetical protein